MWYSWGESKQLEGESTPGDSTKHLHLSSPSPSTAGRGYVATILDHTEASQVSSDTEPLPLVDYNTIWTTFLKNVHPLVKIFFDWEVEPLMRRASHDASDLSPSEKTLVTAIIFVTTKSVPATDCPSLLHEEKPALLNRFQRSTEKALLHVGYATTSNKLTLQAFMLYLVRSMPSFANSSCF